jgi:hypothetical protein
MSLIAPLSRQWAMTMPADAAAPIAEIRAARNRPRDAKGKFTRTDKAVEEKAMLSFEETPEADAERLAEARADALFRARLEEAERRRQAEAARIREAQRVIERADRMLLAEERYKRAVPACRCTTP